MRNLSLLSRVLVRNQYGKLFSKKQGMKKILMTVLLGICMLPVMFMLYIQFDGLIAMYSMEAALSFGFLAIVLAVAISSFLSCFSYLYFADDTRTLMTLPLQGWVIVWAKTIMIYLSCLVLSVCILIPMLIAWAAHGGDFLGGLLIVLQTLISSFTTLFILGILVVVLMSVAPRSFDKRKFTLLASGISIILALTFSVLINANPSDSAVLVNPGDVSFGSRYLFSVNLAAGSVADHSISDLLLSLAAVVLCGVLYHFVSSKLYLKTVSRMSGASSSAKAGQKKGSNVQKSLFGQLMRNEFRTLFRTPAYLMNCVLGTFIGPIVIILMMMVVPSFQELREVVSGSIPEWMPLGAVGFLIGCFCTLFLGSSNGIAATAVSREGQTGLKWMKTVPVSLKTQLLAKMAVAIVFSVLGSLCFYIPMVMFLPAAFDGFLGFLIGILIMSWLASAFELLVDIVHPKLVWDNETAMIKNNYNTLLSLLGSMVFIGLGFLLVLLILPDQLMLASVIIAVVSAALAAFCTWLIEPAAEKSLVKKNRI